jgi:uncharacterized membrane protein YccC
VSSIRWPRTVAAWLSGLTPPKRGDWVFALRATAAGLAALAVAYWLKLENPQWAMMTVFIVAQPVAGMVLAKGFYRLAGTVAGALVAIGMDLVGGSNPLLFLTMMAAWVGISTFAASLLRNPEAYGAALAGYTALIVGLPALGHGHLVIDLALARTTEIMLGIVCAGLASRLILPELARDQIIDRLQGSIRDLATYAEGAFGGAEIGTLVALSRKLIGDIQTIGEMRAYLRLEGPSLAAHGHSVRRTIGFMLSAVSAARMLRNHPPPPGVPPTASRLALKKLVSELKTAGPEALDDVGPWAERLGRIAGEARNAPATLDETDPDRIGTAARLAMAAEFADAFAGVLRGLAALRSGDAGRDAGRAQPALLVHRDRRAALRNAIRAAVATTLVAIFWLATQWADAAGVTVMVAVVSILFAARPAPIETAFNFFKGTLFAAPFAFLAGQILLPHLPGFGWFALVVVPLLIPAALAMANPRWVGTATAFTVNFLVFLSPHEEMTYAPQAFLNSTISILAGILLAIGVFAVVLPARPGEAVARLVAAIREDLVRLCLHERIPRRSAFESLAYDRINQLMPYARQAGGPGEAALRGSVAAVTVGLEILRLRNAMLPQDVAVAVADFLRKLARVFLRPVGGETAAEFVRATRALAADIAGGHDEIAVLQAAASLRVIAAAIEAHPAFFQRGAKTPPSIHPDMTVAGRPA